MLPRSFRLVTCEVKKKLNLTCLKNSQLMEKRIQHFGVAAPVSITENTSIDEFLSNAEAAQRSFEVNDYDPIMT